MLLEIQNSHTHTHTHTHTHAHTCTHTHIHTLRVGNSRQLQRDRCRHSKDDSRQLLWAKEDTKSLGSILYIQHESGRHLQQRNKLAQFNMDNVEETIKIKWTWYRRR